MTILHPNIFKGLYRCTIRLPSSLGRFIKVAQRGLRADTRSACIRQEPGYFETLEQGRCWFWIRRKDICHEALGLLRSFVFVFQFLSIWMASLLFTGPVSRSGIIIPLFDHGNGVVLIISLISWYYIVWACLVCACWWLYQTVSRKPSKWRRWIN